MRIISHRGNLSGPNTEKENSQPYIEEALSKGYDVEVDVWYINDRFLLGHDEPTYEVSGSFLKDSRLWCHAKNIGALCKLIKEGAHCFWHQEDDCTLTSNGYLWTYPGKVLTTESVCVMPETFNPDVQQIKDCLAVCTDYPEKYKMLLRKEK